MNKLSCEISWICSCFLAGAVASTTGDAASLVAVMIVIFGAFFFAFAAVKQSKGEE